MDTTTHLKDSTDELLVILAEECAEATQAIMKLLRHGADCYSPKDPSREKNIEMLHRELGDISAVIELLSVKGVIDKQTLQAYADAKLSAHRSGKTPLHHYPLK